MSTRTATLLVVVAAIVAANRIAAVQAVTGRGSA
jgi:hypothetical protein